MAVVLHARLIRKGVEHVSFLDGFLEDRFGKYVDGPKFICMGFQKSGTTSLFEILESHPQVQLCRDVKEPMFYRVPVFSSIMTKYYYEWRYWGPVKEGDTRMRGEVNAGLTFTRCAKKLEKDLDHSTKMIFMMRNPVNRTYSAYKYFLSRGHLPRGFVEYDNEHGHAQGFDHYAHYMLDNPKRRERIMRRRLQYLVFSQSNYATCIQDYLDRGFSSENMLFIVFEEFVRDERGACREVYDFLGIDDNDDAPYGVRANEGNERGISSWKCKKVNILKGTRIFLYDLIFMSHWAPNAFARFDRYYDRMRHEGIVDDPDYGQKMLPETRSYLMDYFEDEVMRLEKITGRDDLHTIWGYK